MSFGFEKKHSKCLNSILRKEGIVAVKILSRFWPEGNDDKGFCWEIIMPQIPLTAYWITAFQKKSTIFPAYRPSQAEKILGRYDYRKLGESDSL